MPLTEIDRMYTEATALIQLLEKASELSLQISVADNLRKALLLASASYFEFRVCDCVLEFVRDRAHRSVLVENFVRNKAIARQYHTWFDWEGNNANRFFALFGDGFRTTMTTRVKDSAEMRSSIAAFLDLGSERNRLVHQNYATFSMDKTLEEIYGLYKRALVFVEALPDALRGCDGQTASE